MASAGKGLRLVLVGSSSSLGGEVKRRLAERSLPVRETILADVDVLDEEGARRIGEYAGEAQLITPTDEVDFAAFDVALLLGDAAETAPLLDRAEGAGACIDLSGASRRRESAQWVHRGLEFPREGLLGLLACPQPAAATLVSLLAPLARAGDLRSAAATVLLPSSALGSGAADELYEQTVGLLNFGSLPVDRLAHQLAFNLLPYEDPARPGSESLADDLAWEVDRLLGPGAPPCDLQLLLAPTFHGYGFSVRLEGTPERTVADLAARLVTDDVAVSLSADAPASPVELKEERRVLVSRIRRAGEGIFWLWAVADSLGSGAAENAVRLVERFAGVDAERGGNGRG